MEHVKLLVLGDRAEPQLQMLDELRSLASVEVCSTPEMCSGFSQGADVVLNWFSDGAVLESIWPQLTNLRWVHNRSAGLDGMLFPALASSSVTLTNARGVFSEILGEFVIGAVFFFAKDFRRLVTSQMAGRWDQFDVAEVHGQTLGLVGYGDISRAVARRAQALGLRVLALRRRPELSSGDGHVAQTFPPEGKHEMLRQSDYVVVAAPLTPESRGMIARPEFDAMKESAVLINVGRGPVVDEPALVQALRSRRIRGAALDVFDTEPLPSGHPLYSFENVLLSPHSADHTADWKERTMRLFLDNFRRFIAGKPLLNVVNKNLGY